LSCWARPASSSCARSAEGLALGSVDVDLDATHQRPAGAVEAPHAGLDPALRAVDGDQAVFQARRLRARRGDRGLQRAAVVAMHLRQQLRQRGRLDPPQGRERTAAAQHPRRLGPIPTARASGR